MKKTASAHGKVGEIMAKPSLAAWRWNDSIAARRRAEAASRLHWLRPAALSLAFASAAFSSLSAEPLTDSTDRTQEVSVPVSVVVPAGAPAQILLQAIAPGKLGALVEGFDPDHAMYVDTTVVALPQIAMLTRSTAPGDIAAVAALKPGMVVDYGSLSARYVAADEKIGQELKVPAVLFSGDLGDIPFVARTLAKVLGETERGETVAKTAEGVLGRLKALGALPDNERVAIYVARGPDGLNALRGGTSFDEPLRLAGARNVVAGGGGMLKRLSVEDVTKLKPAVVVFTDLEVLSSPLHAAMPKETKWVLDAGEPYKVLAGPPSVNRLIGAAALAAILHPDKAGADPDSIRRIETALFPVPPGVSVPAPLQVKQ